MVVQSEEFEWDEFDRPVVRQESEAAKCPGCNTSLNVSCIECGRTWDTCNCVDGPDEFYCATCGHVFNYEGNVVDIGEELAGTLNEVECTCKPPKKYACPGCNVIRNSEDEPWRSIISDDEMLEIPCPGCTCKPKAINYCGKCEVYKGIDGEWQWLSTAIERSATKSSIKSTGSSDWDWESYSLCRHKMFELTFPSEVTVWASSHFRRTTGDPRPDFAVYLDDVWEPESVAYMIPWQDHGLPYVTNEEAGYAIHDAYTRASEGDMVEVGCIGGHGRTGVVLACFAILAGVPAKDAVKWVRTNYCTQAVESKKQEWYVEWFGAWVDETEPPPMPQEPSYTTSKVKSKTRNAKTEKCVKCSSFNTYKYSVSEKGTTRSGIHCSKCGHEEIVTEISDSEFGKTEKVNTTENSKKVHAAKEVWNKFGVGSLTFNIKGCYCMLQRKSDKVKFFLNEDLTVLRQEPEANPDPEKERVKQIRQQKKQTKRNRKGRTTQT